MKTSYIIIGVVVILIIGIYFMTRQPQQQVVYQGGQPQGNSDLQNAAGIVGGLGGLIGSLGDLFKKKDNTPQEGDDDYLAYLQSQF